MCLSPAVLPTRKSKPARDRMWLQVSVCVRIGVSPSVSAPSKAVRRLPQSRVLVPCVSCTVQVEAHCDASSSMFINDSRLLFASTIKISRADDQPNSLVKVTIHFSEDGHLTSSSLSAPLSALSVHKPFPGTAVVSARELASLLYRKTQDMARLIPSHV